MSASANDLLEMVLRECEIARGEPWYPSAYAAATGVSRSALDAAVDQLRLGGLVRLTDWVAGKGQGYVLTPAGEEVLSSPRLVSRLRANGVQAVAVKEAPPAAAREEQPVNWDRSGAIRDALLAPTRPVVTMTLFGLNVLNFLIGLALVVQMGGSFNLYIGFGADQPIQTARYVTGALTKTDWDQGLWWRLFTRAFVHIGLLHLGMNMYALYALGPLMERLWGRLRYFLLYLLTAGAGSAAGMMLQPADMLAGASTALCGLIGMTLTWLLLNKRYLPPQLAASWMRSTVTNIILLAFISLLVPHVSWAGHLGGAVAGAVLAVPFNYLTFGKTLSRQLDRVTVALLALLSVGLVGFVGWQIAQAAPQLEQARNQVDYVEPMHKADLEARNADVVFYQWANKLYQKKEVTQEETDKVLQTLTEAEETIKSVQQLLDKAPDTEDRRFRPAVGHAQNYFQKWRDYLEKAKQFARRGGVTATEYRALQQREYRAVESAKGPLRESMLNPFS